MKGVVLEVKNGYAAVLKEDGSIIKVKRKCTVGDTIEIPHTMRFVRMAAIAAAALLIILGSSGGYYYTASAASTVTIHSSEGDLTLSLNRLDRVIKVEASGSIREDTVQTLYSGGIRNCNLQDALDKAANVLENSDEENDQNSFSIDIESKNQEKYNLLKGQAEEKGFHIAVPGADPDNNEAAREEPKTEAAPLQPGNDSMQPAQLEQITDAGQLPDQQGEPSEAQDLPGQEAPQIQGQSSQQPSSDNQPAPEMEPGNSNGDLQQGDIPENPGGQPDSFGGMTPER